MKVSHEPETSESNSSDSDNEQNGLATSPPSRKPRHTTQPSKGTFFSIPKSSHSATGSETGSDSNSSGEESSPPDDEEGPPSQSGSDGCPTWFPVVRESYLHLRVSPR